MHISSLRFSWAWGGLYGVLSYALYAFWLFSYSALLFFATLILCSGLCAFLFFILKIADLMFVRYAWIFQVFIFILYEFIKTKGFLAFSYGILGYTQWKNINLIQIADLGGVFAVSFLIVLFSALVYEFILCMKMKKLLKSKIDSDVHDTSYSPLVFASKIVKFEKLASLKPFFIFLGIWIFIFIAAIFYGSKSSKSWKKNEVSKISVAAIQHNENPTENGINFFAQNIRRLIQLTDEALELNPKIKIVLWPETAVTPSILFQYYHGTDENRIYLINLVLNYINSKPCTFVIGNFNSVYEDGEKKDYNSAFVFTPQKNVIPPEPEIYSKIHLVPLSEYFPYHEKFSRVYNALLKLGAQQWEKGKEYCVFEFMPDSAANNSHKFMYSTPICFEDTFGETGRKMFNAGSRCFFNLTNDAWAKSLAAQNQHLSMAVFRSVENKIPTVRSATSGQTCAIMPDGKIYFESIPFTSAYSICEIPIIDKNSNGTFYAKFGDIFAISCGFISIVLLIIGFIKSIIRLWQNR